ncbi:MAG: hypothetical protein HQL99_14160 [Magnetococcales bacterium]|nr:hypothetical protein [Magnetococcales bacterium]
MVITLAYPSIASPTAQVVLPDVEQLPASRPVRMRQIVMETDAGAVVVYSVGNPSVGVFTVSLYPLTEAQAAAVKTFFASPSANAGVNGRAKSWQFRDSRGVVTTVRFAQDVLEPMQRTPNTWAVSLVLREEPA